MTSRSVARSLTVRAIGPSEPAFCGQPEYTRARLTSQALVRIPARQVHVDGRRIDASPSCPMPRAARFAETLAADPPDEPPTVRSSAYGFFVEPKSEPCVSPPPSSPRVDFPRMIAPAFFNFSTTNASLSG